MTDSRGRGVDDQQPAIVDQQLERHRVDPASQVCVRFGPDKVLVAAHCRSSAGADQPHHIDERLLGMSSPVDEIADEGEPSAGGMASVLGVPELGEQMPEGVQAPVDVADDVVVSQGRGCRR